jgi:putative ABC transport system permease protein
MSTRKRSDEDFGREVRAHIEIETERLIAEGLTPDAARIAARRRFGNVTLARERFYEAGRLLWIDHLIQDLRCAARNMRRYPVASLVAVLSLAAGIGATTVTLTIRDVIFRKPPPLYQHPEQLSKIQLGSPASPIMPVGNPVPVALYQRWREAIGPAMAAYTSLGAREIRTGDRTASVPVRAVTPELFSVLGVAPSPGASFSASPTSVSGPPPVILSARAWQELFDRNPDAIGRVVWIDDEAHTVIGVMPERFWFSDMDSPIWASLEPRTLASDARVGVVVRRPADVTHAMLESRLQGGLADYAQHLPAGERQLAVRASGLEGTPIGHQMSFVLPYVLGTAVLLTLLIACANVAILMIAQWTAREHEIAIRASIGASRGRIVRSLLTEAVLVSVCGGILGVCATFALRGWIVRNGGNITFYDLAIDMRILLQTAVIALVTGVAAGVAPALYETRRLHTNPLRTIATSDRIRQRWRHALVVFEIAVTIALLVVTSTMIDGYWRTSHGQMGFSTTPLLTLHVDNQNGVRVRQVVDTLAAIPGVAAASASTLIPTAASGSRQPVAAQATGGEPITARRGEIDPGFFATLGVPIRAGRAFSGIDSNAGRTAIVNETLARQFFQGRDPIGARLWIANVPHDIVGVVADFASDPLRATLPEPRVFVPLAPDSKNVTRMAFLVRAEGDPAAFVQTVRGAARKVAAGTIVGSVETVDQAIDGMSREMMVGTAPLFPLVTIGLMLTMAGIYGVLAFAIARRSRELAVRVAVGASASDVVRLVTAHTARLIAVGSAVGLLLMFALARLVRSGGGAGSIWDPALYSFVLPVVVVVAVGAIATWIPSRRALKIDPVVLLRTP